MTTAPDTAQATLYGPDGRPLPRPATQPAGPAPRTGVPSGGWQPVTTNGNATVWEKTPTPAAVVLAPGTVPQADLDAAQGRITELERRLAVEAERRTPAPTASPAPVVAAGPQPAPAEPKKSWFDRHGPNIAMWAAVGLSASGEYALAIQAHFPWFVAALLPVALDVYVVQAMRRRRDVAAALLLAVAANTLDRLAAAHIIGVDKTIANGHPVYTASWWLIVAVVTIAPFIVWRIHRITETRPSRKGTATAPAAVAPDTATTRATPAATAGATQRPATGGAVAEPRATPTVAAAATPRETVRATLPERPATGTATGTATPRATGAATEPARATPTVAPRATAPEQHETVSATRNATARRRPTATRPATKTPVATPLDRNAQIEIAGRFVDAWDGPDEKLPLQPIADALGRSKSTASRLVGEYRNARSA